MSSYVQESLIKDEIIRQEAKVSWFGQFWLLFLGILTVWFLVGIIFIVIAAIKVKSTELAVTNKKLIGKIGFIRRDTIDIPIQKIESISIEQTLVGRLLNYGTLTIKGTGGDGLTISDVKYPLVFRKAVMAAMDEHNNIV